jgi:hypothetical protein
VSGVVFMRSRFGLRMGHGATAGHGPHRHHVRPRRRPDARLYPDTCEVAHGFWLRSRLTVHAGPEVVASRTFRPAD